MLNKRSFASAFSYYSQAPESLHAHVDELTDVLRAGVIALPVQDYVCVRWHHCVLNSAQVQLQRILYLYATSHLALCTRHLGSVSRYSSCSSSACHSIV
jgi:hypothetical protein